MTLDGLPERACELRRLRGQGGWFRIADVCRLDVQGPDAQRYLNGQLTNDVRKLGSGEAMQACVLSAKGRLDAVVWIWRKKDGFIIESDAAIAGNLETRLQKYIVADDVLVEPVEPAPRIHVFGAPADAMASAEDAIRIRRMGCAGIDIPVRTGAEPEPDMEAGAAALEVLRIERTIPRWGLELGPETLPAEAGLDKTAVDFHKGCYIGQEVVSRIQSVGRVNRVLSTIKASGSDRLSAGMEILSDSGKPAGVITSTAYHFELCRWVALCYVKREIGPSDALEARGETGAAPVELCQIP